MSYDTPAAVLANYIATARFEQLPPAVVGWFQTLVEDNLGCSLGALALAEVSPVLELAGAEGGVPAALAIGARETSISSAVFCNSQVANALDFDDTYDSHSPSHPGCLIIPTALAVAESVGASGRALLTAVTVAYEVALRVGRALGNRLWNSGTPWKGVAELAAAIAAAKLYELDAEQLRAIFSMVSLEAGDFGTQTRRRSKSDLPPRVHFGRLKANFGSFAQSGLWIALKARATLTGFAGLLEGGFEEWYLAGLPEAGFEYLTGQLGEEYLCTKVSLKPTPSCRWTHQPITAVWSALGDRRLDAAHVTRIRILGVPRLERTNWSGVFDAQYSIPCAVALAASGIVPGPEWYASGVYKSHAIVELAAKVVQERDPDVEAFEMCRGRITCRVEIGLKDGMTLQAECQSAKGSTENPLSEAERQAKFAANTAHLDGRAHAVKQAVRGLTHALTVDELKVALVRAVDGAKG